MAPFVTSRKQNITVPNVCCGQIKMFFSCETTRKPFFSSSVRQHWHQTKQSSVNEVCFFLLSGTARNIYFSFDETTRKPILRSSGHIRDPNLKSDGDICLGLRLFQNILFNRLRLFSKTCIWGNFCLVYGAFQNLHWGPLPLCVPTGVSTAGSW